MGSVASTPKQLDEISSAGTGKSGTNPTLPTLLGANNRNDCAKSVGNSSWISKLAEDPKIIFGKQRSLTEEEQVLIATDILDLLRAQVSHGLPVGCISSMDDPKMLQPFREKRRLAWCTDYVKLFPFCGHIGRVCKKGLKPKAPNQDSWCILAALDDFYIYGVFDGRGEHGHKVSQFVMEMLPKLVLQDDRFRTDLPSVLNDAFEKVQSILPRVAARKRYSVKSSGSTATLVVHDLKAGRLTVAHVGDSGCALGGSMLTPEHKPSDTQEKPRIVPSGGKQAEHPALTMSHVLGDLVGHKDDGTISTPNVFVHKLRPHDQTLLVCSHGVWGFLKASEVLNIVGEVGGTNGSVDAQAAERLAKRAWDLSMEAANGQFVDDITALVVRLPAAQALGAISSI